MRDMREYIDTLGFELQTVGRTALKQAALPAIKKDPTVAPVTAPVAAVAVAAGAVKTEGLGWEELERQAKACQACKLAPTRTNVVFGSGDRAARLMFVGEGPGAEEDAQGLPFVGRSGQLLTKMIEAMGLTRDKVYIANVVKCRPPENRNPQPDEIAACAGFLRRQIELVAPDVIVALGTFGAQLVMRTDEAIGKLRGHFHNHPEGKRRDGSPVRVMPTYHPAFCLRNPNMKKPVWEDLQLVMKELGLSA